jgi:glyoxylase-like metal-dependent hydrolase (beta-lactamase superfamily II)
MKTWKTSAGTRIIRVLARRSNVFLITNGTRNLLVDTSMPAEWRPLSRRLKRLGVDHLDGLILTHAHMDHAGNAARIRETFHPVVMVHRNEAGDLASGATSVPGGTLAVTRLLVHMISRFAVSIRQFAPCRYDLTVESRFNLHDFGLDACILHTPGHTAGSVSVIVDGEIALVGDAMFGMLSVFPPFADDPGRLIASWGQLLDTGCSWFLPAHGSAKSRARLRKAYLGRR